MAADPQRVADTRDWLLKASHDIDAAERLLEGDEPLTDVAVFHCQQGAEKALKAFLFWHDAPFRKTHELEELVDAATRIDQTIEALREPAAGLTPFAWRFRYPGELMEPSDADTRAALEACRAVYARVRERLPAEARP